MTDARQIEAAVAQALKPFGAIDVLANNAGCGYQSSIQEGDEREIRAQCDANTFGLFAMTRAVLPGMRAKGSGHVVNITSVAGLAGFQWAGYYAASNRGIEGARKGDCQSTRLLAASGPIATARFARQRPFGNNYRVAPIRRARSSHCPAIHSMNHPRPPINIPRNTIPPISMKRVSRWRNCDIATPTIGSTMQLHPKNRNHCACNNSLFPGVDSSSANCDVDIPEALAFRHRDHFNTAVTSSTKMRAYIRL
ncbi:hypothetical protein F4827_001623 [Paraburkholderia bannensis]|uniref:SDR family NAD(P)-dependent oxidoreductase n=1 Tax=Paraburkholderia bannensis TaxID=765414 RepID=A0A7W9WQ62_9BURK|nr:MULTISPECIES: SDR family NAD(P)-dependent oxidoreductase [Paraburkholderia]MBB3256776.1 hypothetical protein [Paraburkholderia sp. WP4_3_2]MBB6101775.1 hypothetical protein [Paraburkholderia bannensis]